MDNVLSSPNRTRRRAPSWALWLLAAFAVMGVFVQFAVRLDYGPDEPYHVDYAYTLAMTGRLPSRTDDYLVQHPPLPYLVLAVPWRIVGSARPPLDTTPGPRALLQMTPREILARRILRLVCLVECLLTLTALIWLVRLLDIPPGWKPIPVFLVAACPMFQYLSGVVNNESASILISTVVCVTLVARVREAECTLKQALWIGILLGLCPWVKQTALLAVPLAAWTLWTIGDPAKRWARLGIAAAVAIPIGIGWPLHNYLVAGQAVPSLCIAGKPAASFAAGKDRPGHFICMA